MISTPVRKTLTVAVATMIAGAGVGEASGSAPRFESVPYFARVGGDRVVVAFTLNKRAGTREVAVSSVTAKASPVGPASTHYYQAHLDGLRLQPGRRYWVRVRVCAGNECAVRTERLYLHRHFSGRR